MTFKGDGGGQTYFSEPVIHHFRDVLKNRRLVKDGTSQPKTFSINTREQRDLGMNATSNYFKTLLQGKSVPVQFLGSVILFKQNVINNSMKGHERVVISFKQEY